MCKWNELQHEPIINHFSKLDTPGVCWLWSLSSSLSEVPSSPVSACCSESLLRVSLGCGDSLGVELGTVGEVLGAVGELQYCSVSPRLKSSSSVGISEDCRELVPVPRCLLFLNNMASRPLSEAVDCRPSPVLYVPFNGDLVNCKTVD